MDATASIAKQRDRSIQWAVVTSLLSKVGTLLLRLVSIPLAVRILGTESFGIYASITAFVMLIELLHYGMGPVVTEAISKAVAAGDRKTELRVLGTGFLLRTALTLGMALLFGLVIGFVSPASLFGAEYAAFAEIMKRCAYIGLVIIALDFVFLTFEHVRNGYQEARFSNAWGAGGNIVAAVTLALAIRIHPSVETLILAIHGPALLAKVGNTVHLFFQRPYILRSLATFTRQSARLVARGSVGYTIAYVVWCSVEYVIPVLLLGRFIGPSAAGIYEIYVLLHSSFNGVLHMVNFPLLPAFIDAHARGDRVWVERVRRRLQYGTLLLALAGVLGSGLLGTWAMNVWVGEKVTTDPITMTLFGTWFGLHAWRQSHQVILLGLGKLRSCAIAALVEGGIATSLVWIVVSTQLIPGARGVFAALCIAMLLVTAWVFPRLLRKSMPPAETE